MRIIFGWAVMMLIVAASAPALADEPSLDEQLLEGLEDALPDVAPVDESVRDSALDDELGRELGEDIETGPADDPLVRIGKQMRTVEERIGAKHDASDATQDMQEQIVNDIDKLIQDVKRRKKQQSKNSSGSKSSQRSPSPKAGQKPSGSGRTSTKPARDSTTRLGQADAEQIDEDALKAQLKDLWGHLPEREREQMVQWSMEQFLPQYDTMIRRYFLRLAEESARD